MNKDEMRRKVKELSPEQKEFLKKEIERQRLEIKENIQANLKNEQEKTKNNL